MRMTELLEEEDDLRWTRINEKSDGVDDDSHCHVIVERLELRDEEQEYWDYGDCNYVCFSWTGFW
jgi:hypothetical protein